MGVETLVALGLSAEAAATVATVATVASAAGTVYAASQAGKNKMQIPGMKAPDRPQATKTADRAGAMAGNVNAALGGRAGNASTFLTGSAGIDPSTLNLGKNSLLGQ